MQHCTYGMGFEHLRRARSLNYVVDAENRIRDIMPRRFLAAMFSGECAAGESYSKIAKSESQNSSH